MAERDPITHHLQRLKAGDRAAVDALLPLLYADLRALAGGAFRGERGDHTLQPTALVHEAYLRLVGSSGGFESRQHFLAVAARAMRQLLADHARRRATEKRGGDRQRVELPDADGSKGGSPLLDLERLDRALARLEQLDPRQARIVELRSLAGMSWAEVAAEVGIAERTARLDWSMARAWLQQEMERDAG
jgi:RNA polymerase sigma factor (TIGR02999 family)